ncbi:olfactory receptor 10G4-like [Pelodytes ibericus]
MDIENYSIKPEFILKGLPHAKELTIPLVLLLLVIYSFTLLGNILLSIAVKRKPSLHTPMYFFLTNLSFLDICLSSVTLPKLIGIFLSAKTIPFFGCVCQLYFFHFLASAECFLYTVMAYDRYVAICRPLHYNTIMRWKICMCLAFGSWLTGSLHSITHTVLTFQLPFCGSHKIDYFFCDIIPVLKLACTDTTLNKTMILANIASVSLSCFILILISYVNIILTIIKIKTADGRIKAFSTCVSHVILVTLFYVPCIFTYMQPDSDSLLNGTVAVFYTVVTPLLNPIIYSLRNKEVKEALLKMLCSVYGSEVIQRGSERTVIEGTDITLDCRYNGTKYVLIWYVQKSQKSLQLILHDESKDLDVKFRERFSGHHDPEQKMFNLAIRKAQWLDTGIYYCALEYGTVCNTESQLYINSQFTRGQFVNQPSADLVMKEGESATLECTYSMGYPTLMWYIQDPNNMIYFVLHDQSLPEDLDPRDGAVNDDIDPDLLGIIWFL